MCIYLLHYNYLTIDSDCHLYSHTKSQFACRLAGLGWPGLSCAGLFCSVRFIIQDYPAGIEVAYDVRSPHYPGRSIDDMFVSPACLVAGAAQATATTQTGPQMPKMPFMLKRLRARKPAPLRFSLHNLISCLSLREPST